MRRISGFSLIELMVTVAIFAILAGMVVPSFMSFIRDNRLTSEINTLVATLHLARSEAVNRQTIMTLCASDNATNCNTTAWEQGWILFTDANNAGNAILDGADELVHVQPALEGGNTLRSSGFNFSTAGIVQLGSRGFLYGSDPAPGTFVLCDARGAAEAKGLVLNVAGTTRVASDQDDDGIDNLHSGSGNNLSCP